jgi:hypothetical protein
MSRAFLKRVMKLEADSRSSGDIAVWCDEQAGFEATVATMISAGKIAQSDWHRCVPWWEARCAPGAHEAFLAELN